MATELDGSSLRKAYEGARQTLVRGAKVVNLMALYLVLVFGWLGSPGEWVVWSWGLSAAFGSHGPANPDWHDMSAFFCHFLVDDQVLVEADLGRRRWMAGRLADRLCRWLLGPASVNADKNAEEGGWDPLKICWGLLYDTIRMVVTQKPSS